MGSKKIRKQVRLTANPAELAVANAARALGNTKSRTPGDIGLDLTGRDGGTFVISVDSRLCAKHRQGPIPAKVRLRVSGAARMIRMILEGQREPHKAFLTGRLRVQGDIKYLERLLQEIQFSVEPR